MKPWLGLIGFLLLSFLVATVGAIYLPGEWYAGLVKPSWNPPNWVFGPVWTLLYFCIGLSGWLVWREAGWRSAAPAFAVYGLQLVLNAAWSWMFFGLHRPGLAFIEIVALWLSIGATMVLFGRKSRPAALLLLPYLCWVGFAGALNLALWLLNR